MGEFVAFCVGMFVGDVLSAIIMAIVVGAKKSRGNYYLPNDD